MLTFNLSVHLLLLVSLQRESFFTYTTISSLPSNVSTHKDIKSHSYFKFLEPGQCAKRNTQLTIECIRWLSSLVHCSGDIYPNPGPAPMASSSSQRSSSSMSADNINSLNLNHDLSFVQYNVQSISNKLDVLHAELLEFDILAFTETWLLQSYNTPEVKTAYDVGVVYVKEGIRHIRRKDLEIRGTDCIWIEPANYRKRILFGLFCANC